MSAHTPGPWEWGRDMGFFWIETEKDGYNVASVTNHNDKRENEANARLIAAAPELLAALQDLSEAFDFGGIDASDIRYARAAITKATSAA